MRTLALIPARSGSKGVPGKNIRPLAGKPLIQYTIESALDAKLVSKVVVSTDAVNIADAARAAGAEVPFLRPEALAKDDTPTLPVVRHALEFFLAQGMRFDAVCLLQPTTPFRPPAFIDQAIRKFIGTGADSLLSVVPVPHEFNPHWVFEPDGVGFLRLATGEKDIIPRRQELPPAYVRDGALYLTRSDVILQKNSLYGDKIAWIENDASFYINIDTLEDWDRAEQMAQKLKKEAST